MLDLHRLVPGDARGGAVGFRLERVSGFSDFLRLRARRRTVLLDYVREFMGEQTFSLPRVGSVTAFIENKVVSDRECLRTQELSGSRCLVAVVYADMAEIEREVAIHVGSGRYVERLAGSI
jgi:hypothetical protein